MRQAEKNLRTLFSNPDDVDEVLSSIEEEMGRVSAWAIKRGLEIMKTPQSFEKRHRGFFADSYDTDELWMRVDGEPTRGYITYSASAKYPLVAGFVSSVRLPTMKMVARGVANAFKEHRFAEDPKEVLRAFPKREAEAWLEDRLSDDVDRKSDFYVQERRLDDQIGGLIEESYSGTFYPEEGGTFTDFEDPNVEYEFRYVPAFSVEVSSGKAVFRLSFKTEMTELNFDVE